MLPKALSISAIKTNLRDANVRQQDEVVQTLLGDIQIDVVDALDRIGPTEVLKAYRLCDAISDDDAPWLRRMGIELAEIGIATAEKHDANKATLTVLKNAKEAIQKFCDGMYAERTLKTHWRKLNAVVVDRTQPHYVRMTAEILVSASYEGTPSLHMLVSSAIEAAVRNYPRDKDLAEQAVAKVLRKYLHEQTMSAAPEQTAA